MLVVAALGLITSLAGVIVGWRLVGQVERTVDDSLVLTEDTLETLDQTITLADDIVVSVAAGLVAVEATVGTSAGSFDTASVLISDLNDLSEILAPGLTNASATLEELASTGRIIDGFLEDVSSIPFAPQYSGNLGVSLQRLADDIRPLGGAVREAGADLDLLQADAQRLQQDLDRLQASVAEVNTTLAGSEALLERYRAQTGDAVLLASQARTDLGNDVDVTRAFIVAAGVVAALAQIVPLWMGLELLGEQRRREDA